MYKSFIWKEQIFTGILRFEDATSVVQAQSWHTQTLRSSFVVLFCDWTRTLETESKASQQGPLQGLNLQPWEHWNIQLSNWAKEQAEMICQSGSIMPRLYLSETSEGRLEAQEGILKIIRRCFSLFGQTVSCSILVIPHFLLRKKNVKSDQLLYICNICRWDVEIIERQMELMSRLK